MKAFYFSNFTGKLKGISFTEINPKQYANKFKELKNMKFNKTYLTLVFLIIIFTFGCSTKEISNANNNALNNSNAVIVESNNMSNSYNNTSNSTSNTTNMKTPVNENTLSTALKTRLKNDNGTVLPETDWNEDDKWLKKDIGRFYKYDDEFVRDVVCDITKKMLEPNNKKMKEVSQRRLRKTVNNKTICKDAVSEMLKAASDTDPIEMIP